MTIESVKITRKRNENEKYFDLGTGNGYVGFELAKRYQRTSVIGIDIAVNSIDKNNKIARESNLNNIGFISYDRVSLPFEDQFFSGGISRYAIHHFPKINKTVKELNRVLRLGGFFIFSDPKTFDVDTNNFIDKYQQLKLDGHVHFYREDEIDTLFRSLGFVKEISFTSYLTYPRDMDNRYKELIDSEEPVIHHQYKIRIEGDLIYLTVECMNRFYRKISHL